MKLSSSPCLLDSDEDIDPNYTQLGPGPSKQRTSAMQFSSLNTILYCQHWDDSRRFYKELLQLPISFQKDDWFIEFRVNPGAHLSIADAQKCTIPPAGGDGLTLSLRCDDLEKIREELIALELEPTEIRGKGWRLPYFYLYDPEGNRLEFWTPRLARSQTQQ